MHRVKKPDIDRLRKSPQDQFFFQKFVDFKGDEADGEIKAVLTKFDVVDLDGDIIESGAADEWLKEVEEIPMLWSHMRSELIGKWYDFEIKNDELLATGLLYDGVSRSMDAVNLIQQEAVSEISIGFDCTRYGIREDDSLKWGWGFDFREIQIREASIVVWAAHPDARITGFKNADIRKSDGSFDLRLVERRLVKGGLTRTEAADFMHIHRNALSESASDKSVSESALMFLENMNKQLEVSNNVRNY